MGFLDKMKGMVDAVTGNAAKVTIEYEPRQAHPGDTIRVRVTTTSTGGEIKSDGVFIDLRGVEKIDLPRSGNREHAVSVANDTHAQEVRISPPLVLGANETKVFEGTVTVPPGQPSFLGKHARHDWQLRGRLEATGNDPDSGWQDLRVGMRLS